LDKNTRFQLVLFKQNRQVERLADFEFQEITEDED